MTALARVTEGPTQSDLGSEFWYYLAVTIRGRGFNCCRAHPYYQGVRSMA